MSKDDKSGVTIVTIERDGPPFRPEMVPPGRRAAFWLDVCERANGNVVRLPLLALRGAQPGPTLVVLGGVHGDEYEGMAAVRDVGHAIEPAALRGTVLGVPVCNPPAFAAGDRVSPVDGLNLARVFPGRPDGSITEQIAHVLTSNVLNHAEFLIDLHSSGSRMAMPLLVGYYHAGTAVGRRSEEAARRFGVPVIWGHRECTAGRTLSGPHAAGVPWLYTESPGGGWLHRDVTAVYARGVVNVLRYLDQLDGAAPLAPLSHEIVGAGDSDTGVTAPVAGFLRPQIALLTPVATGDLLGTIEDLLGNERVEIRAPASGMLMMRREAATVAAGEVVFLVS